VKEKSDPLNREEKQALRKLRQEAELQRGWASAAAGRSFAGRE